MDFNLGMTSSNPVDLAEENVGEAWRQALKTPVINWHRAASAHVELPSQTLLFIQGLMFL